MDSLPFTTWIDKVAEELSKLDQPLPSIVKEVEWLEQIWEHFYVSPADAALLFTNVYK